MNNKQEQDYDKLIKDYEEYQILRLTSLPNEY